MFFYSLSEKRRRSLPALFTLTLLAFSAIAGLAQNKTAPASVETGSQFFGPGYDAPGYTNSLKNLSATLLPAAARTASPAFGELDPAFNPALDFVPGQARAIAIQPDGKILLGGFFRTLNGVRYDNLVRLNTDYSVDPSFTASVNGTVNAIAVLPDGKIVIGGIFTAVTGVGANNIARLYDHGAIDTTFNTSGGASDLVNDVAVQPDGKIVIAGGFFSVGGSFKPYVARLNANGSVDNTFTTTFTPPGPPTFSPNLVSGIAVQPDGKIILCGAFFTAIGPNISAVSIIRLNADGSSDSSFSATGINSSLSDLALQPDGKILIGGFFQTVGGTPRNRIARLNSDGSLDTSFDPGTGANVSVSAIHLRPSGQIVVGGTFTTFNDKPRTGLAQLNSNGSVDDNFVPNASVLGSVYSVIAAPDGNILVGGSVRINGNSRDTFGVFGPTGSFNLSVNLNSTGKGGTRSIITQPDGKIVVAGNFTRANGVVRNRLARFNPNGALDTTFNSGSLGGSPVSVLALQPDGKILAGGGTVIRLNTDGSVDSTFTQSANAPSRLIKAIAMQPDGKILISYTTAIINVPPGSGDISRLNPDGSLDQSFDGLPLPFESIVVQPDGSILAGGPFSFGYVTSGGGSEVHHGVFKMNADGSHDRAFRAGFVSNEGGAGFTVVYALERQPDGKILVGGSLYTGASTSPVGIARLNPSGTIDGSFQLNQVTSAYEFPRVEDILTLPNGQILIGGLFNGIGNWSQRNIARLDQGGVFDQSFLAGSDGTVFDIAVERTGNVLVGGDFENVRDTPRTGLARLSSEPVIRHIPFDFDGDGKSDVSVFRPSDGNWYLLQSTAGYTGTHFGIAADQLAPADYDGDGKTDIAVFRDGAWYLQQSTAGFLAYNFGQAGDIPQPADFNGDGKAELAVFRPSDGGWYKLDLNGYVFTAVSFGQNGDKPVVGDYDGDGKADPAVYRGGSWYILASTQGYYGVNFGIATDKPVPADYDGDGKTDQAVVRDGFWYLLRSTAGYTGFQWGNPTDLPVAADYDGDGKADVSVFRDGFWYLQQTSAGYAGVSFGSTADKPVPNSFVP